MSTIPGWFRPVAVAALIWNLLGCAAYVADVMITPEQVSQMTEAQQALYSARPSWAVGATATAVWFGAAAAAGPVAFVLQGVVLLIGIGLVLMARKASAQGWLA
jgi:hypothetical protein